MKKVTFIPLLILLLSNCNKTVSDIYTVKNESSSLVEMIDIRGANKTSLKVDHGNSDQLVFDHQRNKDFQIEFNYGPANLVKSHIDSKERKIVFTNR